MKTPHEIAGEIIAINHEHAFASVKDEPGRYLLDFGDRHPRMATFVSKLQAAIAAAIRAERERADRMEKDLADIERAAKAGDGELHVSWCGDRGFYVVNESVRFSDDRKGQGPTVADACREALHQKGAADGQ